MDYIEQTILKVKKRCEKLGLDFDLPQDELLRQADEKSAKA